MLDLFAQIMIVILSGITSIVLLNYVIIWFLQLGWGDRNVNHDFTEIKATIDKSANRKE